jgi:hypothetical protein
MPTGISTAGDFVTTGLTTEKANRVEENDVFQYPVGIASTAVDDFQIVSKQLDLELLGQVSGKIKIINDKKKEAIGLGMSALGPFTPGVLPPICSFYTSTPPNDISSGDGTVDGVTPEPGIGGTATPSVAYSIVRSDNVRIRRYPYLESRVAPNDNALQDMKFPVLTNANAGEGEENLYVINSIYEDTDTPGVIYYIRNNQGDWSLFPFQGEEGDTLGRYYPINPAGVSSTTYDLQGKLSVGLIFTPSKIYEDAIGDFFVGIQTGCLWTTGSAGVTSTSNDCDWNADNNELTFPSGFGFLGPPAGAGTLTVPVGVQCSDLAAKQAALLDEIGIARVGLSTYFVASNTTKIRKHANQLQLWAVTRVDTRNKQETFGTNNYPRDITTTIPSVEAIESQLPTNDNTGDADRGPLTADTTLFTADSY